MRTNIPKSGLQLAVCSRTVLIGLIVVTGAYAGEHGYTDTPLLPGTSWRVHDKNRPQPPMVNPGAPHFAAPPSDAIVLFNGTDLSQWTKARRSGLFPEDKINNAITNGSFDITMSGEIKTKQSFEDAQVHVEWQVPAKPDTGPLSYGNSGVFLLGLYELQIIESYTYQIYADGIAGAIYGQTPPLVNAARPPGEWQSYDIIFRAPRFDADGKLVQPAYFTVFWNGVLVQNHQASLGTTKFKAVADYTNKTVRGPVMLQYHGSHVRFRNIWIRPLPGGDHGNHPDAKDVAAPQHVK